MIKKEIILNQENFMGLSKSLIEKNIIIKQFKNNFKNPFRKDILKYNKKNIKLLKRNCELKTIKYKLRIFST